MTAKMDASPMLRISGIIALSLTIVPLLACSEPCDNDEISSASTTDNQVTAHLFTRNCGATTTFNAQVSVERAGKKRKNEIGNVFVSDGGGADHVARPSDHVRLSWQGNKLVISYDRRLRVFKKEKNVDGIEIAYSLI